MTTALCLRDGYPEGVGQRLLRHYSDPEPRNRLISLRVLNSLGKSPDDPIDHRDRYKKTQGLSEDDTCQLLDDICVTLSGTIRFADPYQSRNLPQLIQQLEWHSI